MTRVKRATCMAVVCAVATAAPMVRAQPLMVEFRSSVPLGTSAMDQYGAVFTVTGLSGIAYLGPGEVPGAHRALAVMDNSNRLVEYEFAIDATGMIVSVSTVRGISVGESADFEDLALVPGGGGLYLCDEDGPGVRAVAWPGLTPLGALPIPAVFASRRANFGFEALTISGDGRDLWTANEEALAVDGPLSTPAAGTVVRLLRLRDEGAGHVAVGQHAYACEPMHGAVISGARSGLVALVVLPSGRMLALERSLAFSFGGLFRSRLFEIEAGGATDVSALASLDGASYAPVMKGLLWSGNVNNLEGLCLGPALGAGGRALIGVVDDGDPLSSNALVTLRITGDIEAPCAADFSGNGAADVPDIFIFLALWFADDARADFDGSGARDVSDIFGFLAAWFAGC
ncbi:MAG: esterase-like activity of phytase family protein [Phycisphaeraceae bacterium]|nr:esterase-like activity of phytase family protein [Phycisphaeraceae bacterium]